MPYRSGGQASLAGPYRWVAGTGIGSTGEGHRVWVAVQEGDSSPAFGARLGGIDRSSDDDEER